MEYIKQFVDEIIDQKIDIFDKYISLISAIEDGAKVVVWGATPHADYIMKCTALGEKNVTWVDRSKDSFQGNKVLRPTDVNFSDFDYVIMGSFTYRKEIEEELRTKYQYHGKIIDPYPPDSRVAFHTYTSRGRDREHNSQKYKRNLGGWGIPDEVLRILVHMVEIRHQINSISPSLKVGVYGTGEHQKYLLNYTDLAKKNVACFINDEIHSGDGKCVLPEEVDFTDIDVIILSKFHRKGQFIRELQEKYTYTGKVIDLYSDEHTGEFFECAFFDDKAKQAFEADMWYHVADDFCHEISEQGNVYINFKIYGKYADNSPRNDYGTNWRYEDTVIVMQGPIKYSDNFTYNSILHYFKIFPGVKIVLSAWKQEQLSERFRQFQTIPGLKIVLCDDPSDPGRMNVNRQLCSSYEGLKYAYRNLNVNYALKIRSDARIYSPEALEIMKTAADFNFQKQDAGLKGRIVCTPRYRYRYVFADYYNFGHIEDMLKFWNPEPTAEKRPYKYIGPGSKTIKMPEGFLYSRYAYRYITPEAEDDEQYKSVIKHFFALISLDAIDFVWNAYNYHTCELRCRNDFLTVKDETPAGLMDFAKGSDRFFGVMGYAEWLKLIAEIDS